MQSLTTDVLLKFLAGELSEGKINEVERVIVENPFYAEILQGLSTMLDELGSTDEVKSFLNRKRSNNKFQQLVS